MSLQIVVIGGGFAGLEAALSLPAAGGRDIAVTLVDRSAFHSFVPSIHEIISDKVRPADIRIPLDTLCGPAGVRFLHDAVVSIDTAERAVRTVGEALPYDFLVLSAGAQNSFFGVSGAERHALPFRSPDDAERIRTELHSVLKDVGRKRSIVLAGGGTEGVEVAGEIIDAIWREGLDDELAAGILSVEIIEGRPDLLHGFPAAAREFARRDLAEQKVTVLTSTRISAVLPDAVRLSDGSERRASLVIWTGGIQPSPLLRELPLPKDPAGWLLVSDTLQSIGNERVFGAGDIVTIRAERGALPIQRLAYHAIDQGRVAAGNIIARTRGRDLLSYVPQERPQLISIGKKAGILVSGEDARFGGWIGDLKKAVERKHLLSCLGRAGFSGLARTVPGWSLLRGLGSRLSG